MTETNTLAGREHALMLLSYVNELIFLVNVCMRIPRLSREIRRHALKGKDVR